MEEPRYIDANKILYRNVGNRFMADREEINRIIPADVAPVIHAHWEWHEEWLPSTTEHPAECQVAEWRCSNCKTLLSDEVDGYWDDIENPPKLKCCPNCGAKMDKDKR